MSKRIGTHNGSFHADEALACYMLLQLPEYKEATITRTRDSAELEKCDIVVDVGGVYDHAALRYDHHQREFKDTFSDKYSTKLSSAGLIYKHYGKQIISAVLGYGKQSDSTESQAAAVELLYEKLYKGFIEGLDGIDNGVNQYPSTLTPAYEENTNVSNLVKGLNPWWNAEVQNFDEQFHKAVALIGGVFRNKVEYYGMSWIPARTIVENAFNSRFQVDPSGQILVLDQFCPWESHLYDIEDSLLAKDTPKPLYVIFQDSNGSSRVRAISAKLGSFENRKPLPASWRGLRDAELSALCGIDRCVFVHSSGFIGGNATLDGALAMAIKAISSSD
ncbi:hypothetical protein BB561_000850 [Smittium simulii]|uniref:Metal-dependent protein hydrolase n=1 Tax=Smittium simulii TaxID=133385 RepID=A0A2T9YXD6_9FUNG|nr:hypothetical protein BB561_000850 [Smittium simulii]